MFRGFLSSIWPSSSDGQSPSSFSSVDEMNHEDVVVQHDRDRGTEPIKSTNGKDQVHVMSVKEFLAPIRDDGIRAMKELTPDELDDHYNPGPTLPDGGVNFECHCVGHLVASPCGYEFRRAITCQKEAGEDELDKGACADEFVDFIQCIVRTKCFKSAGDAEERGDDDEDVDTNSPFNVNADGDDEKREEVEMDELLLPSEKQHEHLREGGNA